MKTISPIITIEQLYKERNSATGEIFLDAVVEALQTIKKPTVSAVAKQLGVNKDVLSGVVKALTGNSLSELIKYWRWQKILFLLENTDMPYPEVAKECGIGDVNGLHRIVDKMLNKTPVEVREHCSRIRWKQNV